MELEHRLKRRLAWQSGRCKAVVGRNGSLGSTLAGDRGSHASSDDGTCQQGFNDQICEFFAQATVQDVVRLLRLFSPDISEEALSSDVHSIVYSAALLHSLDQSFVDALHRLIPRDREEWMASDVESHVAVRKARLSFLRRVILGKLSAWRSRAMLVLSSRSDALTRIVWSLSNHEVMISASTGAVIIGTAGGLLGMLGGVVLGGAVGTIHAPLTAGLSVPVACAAGGSLGAAGGAAAGTVAGLMTGTAVGSAAHAYGAEIKDVAFVLQEFAHERCAKALTRIAGATRTAKCTTDGLAHGFIRGACGIVADRQMQAAVETAVPLAVLVGASAGITGLMAGSTLGAILGAAPALFTLGLSIPAGAALGGGAGLCVASTVGGAIGFVGGGAVGYTTYAPQQEAHVSSGHGTGLRPLRSTVNRLAGSAWEVS